MVEEWKKSLAKSITKPEQILTRFKVDVEDLRSVVSKYPMRISRYYFDLINEVNDPIWKQCVPSTSELDDPIGLEDPLLEEKQSTIPGLVHRYPDRALMCVSNICATYCRFCTRKRKIGKTDVVYPDKTILNQINYVENTPALRDVIISGGDPFMLPDERIEFILKKLRRIPHVEILRIGSRVPCTLPQRITPELCAILKQHHPLYVNVHFNHPNEITESSKRACGLLADAGIQLGNQTVLLRNVNDDPKVMKSLVQKLLKIRVKPYYLFQMDIVKGTNHFRTKVETGINIIESLIGHTSGLAVPRYIIDTPGGGGKVSLQPNYVKSIDEEKVVLRNYKRKNFIYPQTRQLKKTIEAV